MKNFRLSLVALLAVSLFVLAPRDASAAGVACSEYGGTCRGGCPADEIDSNWLYQHWGNTKKVNEALDLKAGEVIDCQGQGVCCLPKGDFACSKIGNVMAPLPAPMAWGCTPSACDKPLITGKDPQNEYCPGTTTCCQYKQRTGTTQSFTVTKGSDTNVANPLGSVSTLTGAIQRVIRVFLGMVGALAFAVFVYSGVTWMTAGSSERVQTAKAAIKYAVIGLILIGFSFAITNFIVDAFANKGSFGSPEAAAPVQEATPIQN